MSEAMEVSGALLAGYAQACINLKIVAGEKAALLPTNIQPELWYPLDCWQKLGELVISAYDDPGPIMERVGIEMMSAWYHHGPGKKRISSGAEFLRFQTGSDGYRSVVKGPASAVGDFRLRAFGEQRGTAVIESSTPFNRDMERGVLIGGMQAPGDLAYIDVTNSINKNVFLITFYKTA
jgi:hypothetical protein